jgi:hypothetical protein
MNAESTSREPFAISPRFRLTIEERIQRLERDAVADGVALVALQDEDHIRRHRRLIAVQMAEALRMRLFLDRSETRRPLPVSSH